MKIAVYGAGAMGTTLGALLQNSGFSVDLISRNVDHVEALKTNGAKIVCSADKREFVVSVNALTPQEATGKYDLIFLMTKQRENKTIAESLLAMLTDGGFVCTTQNGLPEEGLADVLGRDKVLGCVCTWGANFTKAGETELTSSISAMRMEIGALEQNGEKLERLREILTVVGQTLNNENFVKTTENLLGVRWNKLAVNAAFSSLSVITGERFGAIAKRRKTAKIALAVLRECFAVQAAAGVEREPMQGHDLRRLFGAGGFFKTQIALLLLPLAVKKHKNLLSGMLADVKRGRKCEIDFIAGAVVEVGKKYGVETPRLATILELVHGIENGFYEITDKNTAFFG